MARATESCGEWGVEMLGGVWSVWSGGCGVLGRWRTWSVEMLDGVGCTYGDARWG